MEDLVWGVPISPRLSVGLGGWGVGKAGHRRAILLQANSDTICSTWSWAKPKVCVYCTNTEAGDRLGACLNIKPLGRWQSWYQEMLKSIIHKANWNQYSRNRGQVLEVRSLWHYSNGPGGLLSWVLFSPPSVSLRFNRHTVECTKLKGVN